jgi:hypothetical protein
VVNACCQATFSSYGGISRIGKASMRCFSSGPLGPYKEDIYV